MKRALLFVLLVLSLCFMACSKTSTAPEADGEMPILMNLEPALNQGFNVSQVQVMIHKGDFTGQMFLARSLCHRSDGL